MNINYVNKNVYFNLSACMGAFKIEPSLCKFVSIINSTKGLKDATQQQRVATWLQEQNYDVDKVKDHLELAKLSKLQAIRERLKIARQYAKILELYVPDEYGDIKQTFNYVQLVELIKEVFQNHISDKKGDFFTKGIAVFVDKLKFFAKMESSRIFMFLARPQMMHRDRQVGTIYEIASQQLNVVKWTDDFTKEKIVSREISNIQHIHALADFEDFGLEWMQARPLAAFSVTQFYGFLGVKYGENLLEWAYHPHSNEERIAMCKSIMRGYDKILKLEYWQGDIKPDNIVVNGKEAVFIDWTGSRSLHQAATKFKNPKAATPFYMNSDILRTLDSIKKKYKKSGSKDDLKEQFTKSAKAMDFFSIGIVLFYVLVGSKPFHLVLDEEYDVNFPLTSYGIKKESMALLLEKKYSDAIIGTLTEMLAHLPEDRISPCEAITLWENIK